MLTNTPKTNIFPETIAAQTGRLIPAGFLGHGENS
jgi:hypothetical protein